MYPSNDPDDKNYVEDVFNRANAGDLQALYETGALYDMGHLVPMDKVKASRIFKEAADRGHAHAKWLHACELLWGLGTFNESIAEGMRYLDAAIAGGSGEACITKARLCLLGELGVQQSPIDSDYYRVLAKKLDKTLYDPLSDPEYVARISKHDSSGA